MVHSTETVTAITQHYGSNTPDRIEAFKLNGNGVIEKLSHTF